jgi:hypothetical protein
MQKVEFIEAGTGHRHNSWIGGEGEEEDKELIFRNTGMGYHSLKLYAVETQHQSNGMHFYIGEIQ